MLRARYRTEHGHDLFVGMFYCHGQTTLGLEQLPHLMKLISKSTRNESDLREIKHHFADRIVDISEQQRCAIPKARACTNCVQYGYGGSWATHHS